MDTIIGPLARPNHFYPHNFICLPCEPGCSDCEDKTPCLVKFNRTFRVIVLTMQIACIAMSVLIGMFIFKYRFTKVMLICNLITSHKQTETQFHPGNSFGQGVASSRWILLEAILLGCIMLYSTVIIRYYESSTTTCFLEPWFREIGFAFCYGSIIIKIYRIYAEFQTRKAHRVCVRDKDLLKYLFGIVLIVFGYMSAWTALVIEGIDNIGSLNLFTSAINVTSKSILDEKTTENGLKFYVCRQLAWDYVTEIGW